LVYIIIFKRAPQYTIIKLQFFLYLTYFKFKEYALLMSAERVPYIVARYNNTCTSIGTLHSRRPVNPHGWRARLFFHLFSLKLLSRGYPTAPYCNFKNSIFFIPYWLFERFNHKFAPFLYMCTTHIHISTVQLLFFHFVFITSSSYFNHTSKLHTT